MTDNQVTVEQLLRALGQVAVQISEKLDVLTEKMDTLKEAASGAAGPPAPGEEFFGARFDRLEEALSGLAPGDGGPLAARLDVLAEKLDGLTEKMDALKEAASGAAGPPAPGEEFFGARFDRLEEALSGLTPGDGGPLAVRLDALAEKLDTVTGLMAAPSSEEAVTGVSVREAVDSLGERMEKLITGLGTDMKEASERNASGVSEASGLIIGAIGSVPEAVKALQQSLEGKAEDLSREAASAVERAGEYYKRSEAFLDDAVNTGKKTEKAMDAVKEELTRGLSQNHDILSRLEELTTRFADRATDDGIAALNRSAVHHYNIGEYQAAEENLVEAINLDPGRVELWCNLAHVQAASGQEAEAETSFRKALELEPDMDQAVSGLGVLMVAGGRPEEAISFLSGFMADENPSVRTMIAYSRALVSAGRHAEAVSVLERAAEAAPGNPDVKAELAAYTGGAEN